MSALASRLSGVEVFVALGLHGADSAIVGVFGEFWLAQAAARAWCRDNWPDESEPLVRRYRVDEVDAQVAAAIDR